jgi:hypothetical protein
MVGSFGIPHPPVRPSPGTQPTAYLVSHVCVCVYFVESRIVLCGAAGCSFDPVHVLVPTTFCLPAYSQQNNLRLGEYIPSEGLSTVEEKRFRYTLHRDGRCKRREETVLCTPRIYKSCTRHLPSMYEVYHVWGNGRLVQVMCCL